MKVILVFAFLCLLVSRNAFTETDDNYGVSYKTTNETSEEKRLSLLTSPLFCGFDILSIVFHANPMIYMDFESHYKMNDFLNIAFTGSFFIKTSHYSKNDYQILFKPMLIYRPSKTGLQGFYLGIYSNIGYVRDSFEISTGTVYDTAFQIGGGLNTGYKWIFNNGFTIQLGTGIGKTFNTANQSFYNLLNSDGRLTLLKFDFHILDFKIGYSL
jgi:hypothetical protein